MRPLCNTCLGVLKNCDNFLYYKRGFGDDDLVEKSTSDLYDSSERLQKGVTTDTFIDKSTIQYRGVPEPPSSTDMEGTRTYIYDNCSLESPITMYNTPDKGREEDEKNVNKGAVHSYHRTFSKLQAAVKSHCQVCRTFWFGLSESEQQAVRGSDETAQAETFQTSSWQYLTHAVISPVAKGEYSLDVRWDKDYFTTLITLRALTILYPGLERSGKR